MILISNFYSGNLVYLGIMSRDLRKFLSSLGIFLPYLLSDGRLEYISTKDFFSLQGWANVLLACSILGLEMNRLCILKDGEVFIKRCSEIDYGLSNKTYFLTMSYIFLA